MFIGLPDFIKSRWCSQSQILLMEKDFEGR
jgi:hypothetical protein